VNTGHAAQRTTEIMNPVILATRETFGLMLDCNIEKMGVALLDSSEGELDVMATIELTGETNGKICLRFPRQTAFGVVSRLIEIEPEEIDELVCDSIGELANVIGGGTKSKLDQFVLKLGLPQVMTGRTARHFFSESSSPLCLSYNSEIGPFFISFAFDDAASEMRVAQAV